MRWGANLFDRILVILVLGVTIFNILLFTSYLVYRRFSSRISSSKTDRPTWIATTLLSGTLWLAASLHLTGAVTILSPSPLACVVLKYWLQYTFGYIFWICCIIYRMVRLYMVMTLLKKPWHALVILLVLLCPFVLLSALASGVVPMSASSNEANEMLCVQSKAWNYLLHSLSAVYFIIFAYLTFRLRRITGSFREMRRYIVACALSFVFFVTESLSLFISLEANPSYRRLLLALILFIVTIHTWSIFAALFFRKKPSRSGSSDFQTALASTAKPTQSTTAVDGVPAINFLKEDEKYHAQARQSGNWFTNLFDLETSSIDSLEDQSLPNLGLSNRIFTLQKARLSTTDPVLLDFEVFLNSLPPEDAKRVDRNKGFFVEKYRPRMREIEDRDIEAAFKYLDAKPDANSFVIPISESESQGDDPALLE